MTRFDYEGPLDGRTCEYAGHEWAPAGGGMVICLRCETERECDEPWAAREVAVQATETERS